MLCRNEAVEHRCSHVAARKKASLVVICHGPRRGYQRERRRDQWEDMARGKSCHGNVLVRAPGGLWPLGIACNSAWVGRVPCRCRGGHGMGGSAMGDLNADSSHSFGHGGLGTGKDGHVPSSSRSRTSFLAHRDGAISGQPQRLKPCKRLGGLSSCPRFAWQLPGSCTHPRMQMHFCQTSSDTSALLCTRKMGLNEEEE
ncbi:hypothetical protein VDGL01_07679 [Verticillium dahliae]